MKAFVVYLILCFIGSGIINPAVRADDSAAGNDQYYESTCDTVEYCEAVDVVSSDAAYIPEKEDLDAEVLTDDADEVTDDDTEADIIGYEIPDIQSSEDTFVEEDDFSDDDDEWDDFDQDDDDDDEYWEEDDYEDEDDNDQDDDDDDEPAELISDWPYRDDDPFHPDPFRPSYVHNEVIFLADSEEEALGVADEYGLTLKSYSYGVAVLDTGDKDAYEVVAYGRENGLTPVEINHIIYLDDPVDRFDPIKWERTFEEKIDPDEEADIPSDTEGSADEEDQEDQ